jgi:hypothetical protein
MYASPDKMVVNLHRFQVVSLIGLCTKRFAFNNNLIAFIGFNFSN